MGVFQQTARAEPILQGISGKITQMIVVPVMCFFLAEALNRGAEPSLLHSSELPTNGSCVSK